MFLVHLNSGQAYLVIYSNQFQRKIMSRNFDLINKPKCYKRDIVLAFEA